MIVNKRIYSLGRKKKNKSDEEYEFCVICKGKTKIKKSQATDQRYGYVEGAGQVCLECYKDLKND